MVIDNIRFVCDTNFPKGLYCTCKTVSLQNSTHTTIE